MGNFFGGKKKNKATATTASSDAGQAAADTKKPKKGTSKPESDAAPAVERSDATGENGSVKRTSKKHATTDPPATDSPKKTRKPKGKVAAESDSASAEPKPKSKKSERAKSNEDDGGDFGDELVNAQKKVCHSIRSNFLCGLRFAFVATLTLNSRPFDSVLHTKESHKGGL
jgi:hypothetical protein